MEPFVALMRRYVVDYTNRHDTSVCDDIMESDYTLHMGPHVVSGRDEQYKAAAQRQFAQFPGLGLTVHEIVTNGGRLAMRFSEHGRSRLHDGRAAAWGGVGLYRWNGSRLTANFVEQDYYSRTAQLSTGSAHTVEPAAVAPWDTEALPPNTSAEQSARRWLERGVLTDVPVTVDDSSPGDLTRALLEVQSVTINDLFSAGGKVAFHATQRGVYAGGLDGCDEHVGSPGELHLAGILDAGDEVTGGAIVRNRKDLQRTLAAVRTRA